MSERPSPERFPKSPKTETGKLERAKVEKKSATSGQHPAVQAYRKKMESITEGVEEAAIKLDHDLDELLNEIKSSVPPPSSDRD